MSEGLNKVFLQGNLTEDAELRATQNSSVLKMRVAVNERYKTGDGDWKEKVEFINVDLWGKRGEALSEYLKKGSSVLIEGSITTDSWDDKDSGKKRYSTSVRAHNIILTGGGGGSRDDDRGDNRSRGRDDDRGRSRDDDRGHSKDADRGRGRNDDRGDDRRDRRDGRGGFEP